MSVDSANAKNLAPALNAIAVGIDRVSMRLLRQSLSAVVFTEIEANVQVLLQHKGDIPPDLIFCGKVTGAADLVDFAQAVRSVWAEPPMYFVSTDRKGFDQQAFAKNGFSDAFLLPMDKAVLRGLIPDGSADYHEVALIELKADTVLNFDTYIYLPLNRKFIRFGSAGYPLARERAKRLHAHEVRIVYVAQDQLPTYVKFTAAQLKGITTKPGTAPAERKKQMQTAVRALLTGFLTENANPADYSEIIKTYILETSAETDSIYERMLKLTGSGDAYTHVSNVSSLASMFSLGIGIGKVEEIALAGLLHDIGLADIDPENLEKSDEDRSAEERLAYQQHPNLALQIIKQRQIELNTRVLKIIEQHHERWNARGYPAELREEAILPESQLLAIADELEYARQIKPGKTRIPLREAAEKLLKSPDFNPELLKKLAELLGMSN